MDGAVKSLTTFRFVTYLPRPRFQVLPYLHVRPVIDGVFVFADTIKSQGVKEEFFFFFLVIGDF